MTSFIRNIKNYGYTLETNSVSVGYLGAFLACEHLKTNAPFIYSRVSSGRQEYIQTRPSFRLLINISDRSITMGLFPFVFTHKSEDSRCL